VIEDGAGTIGGTLSVSDVDAGEAAFKAVAPADLVKSYGTFAFNAATGVWGFTLDEVAAHALKAGQEVQQTLTVDSLDGTASKTITVTVVGTNDAPIAGTVDLGSLVEEGTRLITQAQLLTGVADVDGPSLRISSVSLSSANGSLTPNGDGTWTYTGAPNDATSVSFSYTASDNDKSAAGTATLDLTPVNDAPAGITLARAVAAENSRAGTALGVLAALDVDSGDTHTYSLLNNAGGRFAISGNTLVVANGALLDYEQAKSHSVVVRTTDQSGAFVDETFTIGVVDDTSETAVGTIGNDVVMGGSGADNLSGGAGADSLSAGAGKDVLNGGSGNDKLRGGLGIDKLTGGTGKDYFIFDDKETGASKFTADYILDFRGTLGDRIDLRLVDANVKAGGDQAFTFIGKEAFTKAGQIRYEKTSTDTWVYLNTDADTTAEAVIRLKGAFDVSKAWFVL
jgi:VCBS repeat-containing protein